MQVSEVLRLFKDRQEQGVRRVVTDAVAPLMKAELIAHTTVDEVFAHRAIEDKLMHMLWRARDRLADKASRAKKALTPRLTPRSILTPRSHGAPRVGARGDNLPRGDPLPLSSFLSPGRRSGARVPFGFGGSRSTTQAVPESVRRVADTWRPELSAEEENAMKEYSALVDRSNREA